MGDQRHSPTNLLEKDDMAALRVLVVAVWDVMGDS